MTQDIQGISDTYPVGYESSFEETEDKKGCAAPRGASSVSTIQPCTMHMTAPQVLQNIPFVSKKSDKDYTTTLLLCFLLGVLGAHDFYAGNMGKGIGKLILGPLTGGIYTAITMIIDIVKLCQGTYTDDQGKFIKA